MTQKTEGPAQLHWLLDRLVAAIPGIHHAIVLTEDGLPLDWTEDLDQDDAEHLSAVASGLQSLSRCVAHNFDGGEVRQTVVEMANATFCVADTGQGARLAALAAENVDAEVMAFEMNCLVKQVGQCLGVTPAGHGHGPTGARA